ncbi:hypothetical protein MMC20_006411 [Loxospora ochrophaea]|nr:hypothetical protein [Loxospora ochrophaea]
MASSFSHPIFRSSLPEQCTPENGLLSNISSAFNTCLPTPLALLSTLLGCLSILSWLFAQLPQIIKNYSLQSTSGLSIYFLLEWCLGDTTNLIGSLLTNQALWQVVVAAYYVCVDVILVTQYLWYTYLKSSRAEQEAITVTFTDGPDDGDTIGATEADSYSSSEPNSSTPSGNNIKSASQPHKVDTNAFGTSNYSAQEKESHSTSGATVVRSQGNAFPFTPSPKTLLLVSMTCAVLANGSPLEPNAQNIPLASAASADRVELAGRVLSWVSTILYLGSRLPQIFKNHVRRSTSGLSPSLFIAAFFGNLFYSTSLLTNPLAWSSYPSYGHRGWAGLEGSDRREWVNLAIPFFLGAAGVLFLDAAVGVQFLMFGEGRVEKMALVGDRKGHNRWQRVSGWMRGWVPSPTPTPREEIIEDERPLLERGIDEDSRYGSI